jgi:hypothetical protein
METGPLRVTQLRSSGSFTQMSLYVDENRVIFLHGRDCRRRWVKGTTKAMLLPNCWLHDQNPVGSAQENTRLPYATGSTRLAITVRGSSRRIMIMRFRPRISD